MLLLTAILGRGSRDGQQCEHRVLNRFQSFQDQSSRAAESVEGG